MRPRRGCHSSAAASLYRRLDGIDSVDRRRARGARADRRADAAPDGDTERVRVQSALPEGIRALPPRATRPAAGRKHAGRLLAACARCDQRPMSIHPVPNGRGMSVPLVELIDVARYFDVSPPWLNRVIERKPRQILRAVDGVSFAIEKGETLGLVGESGCGKSTVARLIVGLYRPTRGEIRYAGRRVDFADAELSLRRTLQMIFQDPYASLNPRWRVTDIIAEPLIAHRQAQGLAKDSADIKARVGALLEQVGLSAADGNKYPHQFSGGQRQRISIAR